jgi:RND family efflux transporter MFP subunit
LAFGWVTAFAGGCGEEPQAAERIRPVRFAQAELKEGGREVTFAGVAQASSEIRLSFKVSGAIEQLAVDVGDAVEQGDLIAALEPEDYELAIQEAREALAGAVAQARRARAALGRVAALYERGNAPASDYDEARAAAEAAEAKAGSLRTKIELAERQLTYTRLTAPAKGKIAYVAVEEEENVSPGVPIAILTTGGRIEVEVMVPEGLITQIERGDEVDVRFDALQGERFEGVVSERGVASIGLSTTYPVRVSLQGADSRVLPGMAAAVTFRAQGGEDRVVVPASAVAKDRAGAFVFTLEPAEGEFAIARRRAVEPGELRTDGITVLSGLEPGTWVVTAGVTRLEDGRKVRAEGLPQRAGAAS